MRRGETSTFSIAVFPFLKTTSSVTLGGLRFSSTDDLSGLSVEQTQAVNDIAGMLFLQDNLRLKSATYAVVPPVDLTRSSVDSGRLADVQAVVAYLYASPHELFGTSFLSAEHASMVVLTPGLVSSSLVQPDFHVEPVGEPSPVHPDRFGEVPGYSGLYDFRHRFWAVRGSRIYGRKPHMTLNLAQDFATDVEMACAAGRAQFGLLLRILDEPPSANAARILTAIRWFNDANLESSDDAASLVSLAIAFESLLGLPQSEKTERLVDSIALLLGRVPRADVWAHQFYRARSAIVHEGRAVTLRFIAADSRKAAEGPEYQPLLSYGMRIFRLCLSTLLVGSDLAQQAGLEDLFVTNEQRFERACRTLSDTAVSAGERLDRIEELVDSLDRHRFLGESGLRLDTMVNTVRLAVEAFIEIRESVLPGNAASLASRVSAMRSSDPLAQLAAIDGLESLLTCGSDATCATRVETVRRIARTVWGYVFMHYHWLRQERETDGTEPR